MRAVQSRPRRLFEPDGLTVCADDEGSTQRHVPAATLIASPFPTKDVLLESFRGNVPEESGLSGAAARLADLHRLSQTHPQQRHEIDRQRGELVTAIDCWVTANTPPPHLRARMHTETVGTLIDRMAAVAATAFHVLMTEHPGSDIVHAAWTRLAELENAYSDLTDDLTRGWRRLPNTPCDTTERSITE